jgi:serine/threonine protein kinase
MNPATCTQNLPDLRDYELLGRIADGSMASVYRGRRREDGRLVAVKIPHRAVSGNKVLRQRFQNEYRIGRQLDHPNVVHTLDFGQEGGTCFLVLELVEGVDLWERVARRGPLPEAEAVNIIAQVARGLHEIHKYGVIHRDVKPDNILLAPGGQAKLADLGLIKDLEGELNLTCANKGIGTPNFIAPEQFTEAQNADVRCDVYSLGASLYHALTGVLPFDGDNLSVILRKKFNNDLKPAREIVPALSEAVDWAIRRTVHADPQYRPASCQELIQLLSGEKKGTELPRLRTAERSRPAENRRRSVRYPCALATVCEVSASIHEELTLSPSAAAEERVRGPGVDSWPGQVLNLSVNGVGLLLGRRFEPGTTASLVLATPDQSVEVQVEMHVVRALALGNNQWFIGATLAATLERDALRKLL